jgi:hypothetical protein
MFIYAGLTSKGYVDDLWEFHFVRGRKSPNFRLPSSCCVAPFSDSLLSFVAPFRILEVGPVLMLQETSPPLGISMYVPQLHRNFLIDRPLASSVSHGFPLAAM